MSGQRAGGIASIAGGKKNICNAVAGVGFDWPMEKGKKKKGEFVGGVSFFMLESLALQCDSF